MALYVALGRHFNHSVISVNKAKREALRHRRLVLDLEPDYIPSGRKALSARLLQLSGLSCWQPSELDHQREHHHGHTAPIQG